MSLLLFLFFTLTVIRNNTEKDARKVVQIWFPLEFRYPDDTHNLQIEQKKYQVKVRVHESRQHKSN